MSLAKYAIATCLISTLLPMGLLPVLATPIDRVASTPQKSATQPVDPALQTALQTAIASYMKQQGAIPDSSHRFFADYIDLNGNGVLDALVVFSSSYWCGTGGCTMLVLEGQKNKTFRLVSESSLVRPPVTASARKTNGWSDLIIRVSGGGVPAKTVALKFDKKKYPPNPSDLPSLPPKTSVKGTVIFPEGSQPQTLPETTAQRPSKPVTTAPRAQETLVTYDDPTMAIATKYPANMTVEPNCSGEGCGYFFKFKPQNNALDRSEVHIFLPRGAKTTAEVEKEVTGSNGLLTSNGWISRQDGKPPQGLNYPWVKKIVNFATADKKAIGQVLIGETNGQGLRVTLFYPTEMSNTYLVAAKMILNSLRFKPDKLPLKPSKG